MEQKRLPVFAERFSELRGNKTQGEFAEFLGISRPTVGFYENGTRIPDALVLRQISEKCQVSTDWLLGISEYKRKSNEMIEASDLGLSEQAIEALKDLSVESDMSETILPVLNRLLCTEEFVQLLTGLYALKIATEHSLNNPEPAPMTPRWKQAIKDKDKADEILNRHERGMYQIVTQHSYLDMLHFHLEAALREVISEYVYDRKELSEHFLREAKEMHSGNEGK